MNKCWNCGVEFIDPTNVCPLCKCITERDDAEEEEFKPTYPFRPDKEIKKIQLALSIYTLAAIIAEAILVIIDFHVGDRIGWSIMTGACMVYAYITLKFSIQKHNGYQFKILMQTLLGVAVVVLIDFFDGIFRMVGKLCVAGGFCSDRCDGNCSDDRK